MKNSNTSAANRFKRILISAVALMTLAGSCFAMTACGDDKKDDGPVTPSMTHDPVTLEVTGQPGTYHWHNFVDGKCTMCDETTIFTQDKLGGTEILTTPASQQGTVTSFTYETRSYYAEEVHADLLEEGQELWITKKANIYLPYGYDPDDTETKYNVLYLLHGNGLNENYWFAQGEKGDGYGEYTPDNNAYTSGYGTENVLDHLMEDGRAAKTIIVTPTFYSPAEDVYGEQFAVDRSNMVITQTFWQELKNELMPYVATHYNTYAEITDDMTDEEVEAELIANRDHQGYAGLSMGGMTSFASVWKHCIDYISYIGCFSGASSADADEIIEQKNNGAFKDYDINYWFVGVGTSESPEGHLEVYLKYKNEVNGFQSGSDIKNGDNCEFCVTNNTAHNYATWITDLYNCMLVFFQK